MQHSIFELCEPREDARRGKVSDADLAADLASVVRKDPNASLDYTDPARFFSNTYPTRGLRNLLDSVCRRLSGGGGEAAAVLRLDTSFGGGKTHGLIALVHAARGMQGVANAGEFVDPSIIPRVPVRIAAFDGENADPANGRSMGDGIRAHTPWGEIAYALAGREGFERVRASDEQAVAPGAETIKELFGGQPTLIVMDEPAIYLRKVHALTQGGRDQLAAFLTSLIKAVESTPNVALVFSLAIGKEGRATDAYADENDFLASRMAELESVAARKATLLNPTEDDETPLVLRRRLFARIDDARASEVVAAYREVWRRAGSTLPQHALEADTAERFKRSYPLHPELLDTLMHKTATLGTFHRVRGMLRLLVRTVTQLWRDQPPGVMAIHVHHLDPGNPPIYQEIVTRLEQRALAPAIRADVVAEEGAQATAQVMDRLNYAGLPPYGSLVGRVVLMHTLAFNADLRGLTSDELRFSILAPGLDASFIDDARTRFVNESAYLDDRPSAPIRFLYEPNLTQLIRREERHVDREEASAALRDLVREIFSGTALELVPFPAGEWDVPDDVGQGLPRLVLLNHEAELVRAGQDGIPERVERIYERRGSNQAIRMLKNNLVFLLADAARVQPLVERMVWRLAVQQMNNAERLRDLPEHQQAKLREWNQRSRHEVAVAIQQCYRHLYYPARNRAAGASVDLAHSVIELGAASDRPGAGQQQVLTTLRDLNKLRGPEDPPDSPSYVRDRTPLKKGQISAGGLRNEFRADPALSILLGDDSFVRMVHAGIERGDFIYQRGDLICGPGEPRAQIVADEQSMIFTRGFAEQKGLWPRAPKAAPAPIVSPRQDVVGDPAKPERDYDPHRADSGASPPSNTPEPAVAQRALQFEGPLRQALATIVARARERGARKLTQVSIQMFDSLDLFKLLPAANGVAGADKRVKLGMELEMAEGGALELNFEGPLSEAQLLREFLQPQLQSARDKNSRQLVLAFGFREGLDLASEAPEKLIEQLTRVGNAAAFVTAEAEAS